MGWWGFTFPLGVYSVSTILIGEELPSLFFRVLGTIFGTAVVILWIVIAAGTARGAWSGVLFNAPCLAKLTPQQEAIERASSAEEKQVESSNEQMDRNHGALLTPEASPPGRSVSDIDE